MALRFLEDHLRDIEERVGPSGHFDLAREGFDALFIGDQAYIDFGQRRRQFARLTPLAAVSRFAAVRRTTFADNCSITAVFASGMLASLLAGRTSIPASAGRALAPRLGAARPIWPAV